MISMMSVGSTDLEGGYCHQAEPEMEFEENDETSPCSPLLLRGGGGGDADEESSSLLAPQTIVEQTTQPDGSIAIKASTVTPHPNGYRDVKIEHFLVPADEVRSVDTTPGSAPLPGTEYLSRVEYRVLSPGLDLEPPDDDASTVYSTVPTPNNGGGDASSVASTYRRSNRRRKRNYRHTLLITSSFIFFVVMIGLAFIRDNDKAPEPTEDTDVIPGNDNDAVSPPVAPGNESKSPSASPPVVPSGGNDASGGDQVHHHHHHHHSHGEKNATLPGVEPLPNSTWLYH